MHIDCLWLLYLRVGVAVVGDQESLQGCVWVSCGSHTVTAARADKEEETTGLLVRPVQYQHQHQHVHCSTPMSAQSIGHVSLPTCCHCTVLSNRERGAASGGEGGKGRSRTIQEDLEEP